MAFSGRLCHAALLLDLLLVIHVPLVFTVQSEHTWDLWDLQY